LKNLSVQCVDKARTDQLDFVGCCGFVQLFKQRDKLSALSSNCSLRCSQLKSQLSVLR